MTDSHLKQLVAGAVAALAVGGCAELREPTASTTASALTIDDVDFAPECAGILGYANAASFAELDSYLPVNVVDALVQRRAVRPFDDLADLSSVSGIAQARLEQIAARARTLGAIGPDCAGVFEELAVSADDQAAILTYVNAASADALWDVVRSEPDTVVPLLLAGRPFPTLGHLAAVSGVGPSTFRSMRDAAIEDPFDELIERVNGVHREASIKMAFNWFSVASDQPGRQSGMLCFGVPAELVDTFGGEMRPDLATASEVLAVVTGTVNFADRFDEVGDAGAGLAHLSAQLTGHSFLGCYISFQPNPFCGFDRAFFVNKNTGHRVLTETFWCE